MEKTFIRILNKTLLIGCLILLSGAILLAGLSAYNFSISFPKNVPPVPITVSITSFAQAKLVAQQVTQRNTNSGANSVQIDPTLFGAANEACEARDRFVMALTNSALKIQDISTCAQNAAQQASSVFGERAGNFLTEEARHFNGLATDPYAKTFTAARDAETIGKTLDGVINRYTQGFSGKVAEQEAEKTRQLEESATHRAAALWSLAIAGAAFGIFLLVAFFIVMVRMEKHLDRLADCAGRQA